MRILLGVERKTVSADLIKENFHTAWVRLCDGHIIIRRKIRDFIDFEGDKLKENIQPMRIAVKKIGFWHRLMKFIKNLLKRRNKMVNLLARAGQLISPFIKGFIRVMRNERGEVVIPFIESVAEEQRPAVTSFITNSGATTEDIASYKSFDEFLSGYKPKAPSGDWASALEPEHRTLLGVKGWKTPADIIKSYKDIEHLVPAEKIAMPYKDKDGNFNQDDLKRVFSQLGLPKDPKEYKPSANFKLPEGITLDAKFIEGFNAKLHKAGFLPHQYALVMDELANVLNQGTQAQIEANNKAFNEANLNLRSKWGLGYEEKSKLANAVLKNFCGDPKQGEAIAKKYGNDPFIIELLANVGGNLSEEALDRTNMSGTLLSPEAAQLEINTIKANPAYLDSSHPSHQYLVDRMYELQKMLKSE
ncbi:MAG: hypothetical protein WC312_03865 [Candidatus Omnitrophota bacterium]|jgi:hypothetical protein